MLMKTISDHTSVSVLLLHVSVVVICFQGNTSYKSQVASASAGVTQGTKRSYSETVVYRDIRRSVEKKHVSPEEKKVIKTSRIQLFKTNDICWITKVQFLARLDGVQEELLYYPAASALATALVLAKLFKFYVKMLKFLH